jgi:hypothetical protein
MPTGPHDKFLGVLFHDMGQSITDVVPPDLSAFVPTSDPAEVHDCFDQSGLVVVSTAFKKLVEDFEVPKTEFFPAKVVTIAEGFDFHREWRDGITLDGYWLMNCWNRVDATKYIDFDKSILRWQKSFVKHRPPWIVGWDKLAFKEPVPDDLYGFEEHLPCRRYVSPRFKEAADAAGIRAGIFQKIRVVD